MFDTELTQQDLVEIRRLASAFERMGSGSSINGVRMDHAARLMRKILPHLEVYLNDEDTKDVRK
jgi:hypothetical protein